MPYLFCNYYRTIESQIVDPELFLIFSNQAVAQPESLTFTGTYKGQLEEESCRCI